MRGVTAIRGMNVHTENFLTKDQLRERLNRSEFGIRAQVRLVLKWRNAVRATTKSAIH